MMSEDYYGTSELWIFSLKITDFVLLLDHKKNHTRPLETIFKSLFDLNFGVHSFIPLIFTDWHIFIGYDNQKLPFQNIQNRQCNSGWYTCIYSICMSFVMPFVCFFHGNFTETYTCGWHKTLYLLRTALWKKFCNLESPNRWAIPGFSIIFFKVQRG